MRHGGVLVTPDPKKLAAFDELARRAAESIRAAFDDVQDTPTTVFDSIMHPGSPVGVFVIGSTNPETLRKLAFMVNRIIQLSMGSPPDAVVVEPWHAPAAPPSSPPPSVN